MWLQKSRGKLGSAPKLRSLPPTTEIFELHVKRAHYQCILWKSSIAADPPDLNPCEYGWEQEVDGKILRPIGIPRCVPAAPK